MLLERARTVAGWIVGTTLLVSAVLKVLNAAEFAAYIDQINDLPLFIRDALPWFVPSAEFGVAGLLAVPATRLFGLRLALGLLCVFTTFLIAEVLSGSDVACTCFGDLMLASNAHDNNRLSLARNCLLMGMIVFASRGEGRRVDSPSISQQVGDHGRCETRGDARSDSRGAFTLVELLIVVGIIALLMAILLPVLGTARRQAREAVCRSNLNQIGQAAVGWAADHGGFLPLDGEINIHPNLAMAAAPVKVHDTAQRRYSYGSVDQRASHAGSGHRHVAGRDSFMVGMLRYIADNAGDGLLDYYTLDWTMDVRSKLGATETFQCPSADRAQLWVGQNNDGFYSDVLIIDGEVFAGSWSTTSDYSTNGGLLSFQHRRDRLHRAYRGQLSRVTSAATMVLAGDGDGDFMSWTPNPARPEPYATLADVLGRTPQMTHWGFWKLPQLDPTRHDGRVGVLFVDGHVEGVRGDAESLGRADLLRGR